MDMLGMAILIKEISVEDIQPNRQLMSGVTDHGLGSMPHELQQEL
jgi:hypothetical protein